MLTIGVDVGGSKASVGVVDTREVRIVERAEIPTPPVAESGEAFLTAVAEGARRLASRYAMRMPAGIGICELVDTDGGILSAHRVRWETPAVHAAFSFASAVGIEADVRAAALAEAKFGAAIGLNHWIYANAGTGVATVLMERDVPYIGARGRGVAMGMSPANLRSAGTSSLSVEDLAGGAGMLARAREAGLAAGTVADLIDRANAGSASERTIVLEGGRVLGRALALLANSLDPQAVVLGGGIASASPAYAEACRDAFDAAVWCAGDGIPVTRPARFGADSGLVGAALIAAKPAPLSQHSWSRSGQAGRF